MQFIRRVEEGEIKSIDERWGFHGTKLDSINSIIKNVGFFIAPQTHSESFGITILEAINAGNIAICSNLTAFIDLLGDSGIYFKNDNLQSLLKVLNKLNNTKIKTCN